MTQTRTRPARWLSATGLGIIAAWTLSSCGGGPPALTDITGEARQSMEEATSFTYTVADPDGVHGDELESGEFSSHTDQVNYNIVLTMPQADVEVRAVDESTAFLRLSLKDEALSEVLGDVDTDGQWIEVPESEQDDLSEYTEEVDGIIETTFSLLEGLSDEELDSIEVEDTELDGQAVYKYLVPATTDSETAQYTGAETVEFYFLQETSELVQVDASTGDSTATHAFSDLNDVETFEAPPEDEIADFEWSF